MTSAFNEVQLVAVEPVPRRHCQQDGEDDSADCDDAPVEGGDAADRISGVPARVGEGVRCSWKVHGRYVRRPATSSTSAAVPVRPPIPSGSSAASPTTTLAS